MRTLLCDDCTNSDFCGVIDPNEFFPIFWKFHCKKKNFTCLLLDGFLFFFASQIKLPHLRTLVLHNPCFSLLDCVRHPVKCSSPSVRVGLLGFLGLKRFLGCSTAQSISIFQGRFLTPHGAFDMSWLFYRRNSLFRYFFYYLWMEWFHFVTEYQ